MSDEDREGIWIETIPSKSGKSYLIVMTFDDHQVTLTKSEAVEWAKTCFAAKARSEYDAAVMRQMTTMGLSPADAVETVKDMRLKRQMLSGSEGLTISANVAVDGDLHTNPTFRPFLVLNLEGRPIGHWDGDDATQHASAVMEVIEVSDLDMIYKRALIEDIDLDPELAAAAVGHLRNFREDR